MTGQCQPHPAPASRETDHSILCVERVLELSPGSSDVAWLLTDLADAYMLSGRFEDAIAWSKRSLKAGLEGEFTYRTLAVSYAHLDRMSEAHQAIGTVLAMKPNRTVANIAWRDGPPTPQDRI